MFATCNNGTTPLMIAADQNQIGVVHALMKTKDIKDNNGHTALDYAFVRGF